MSQIIFVTGTDTGVGKTFLTALLLVYTRQRGQRALGLKPFCSGGRDDAHLLAAAQGYAIDIETVNPFYFPDPVAPRVAARRQRWRRRVELGDAVGHVRSWALECELLLVEGAGGLLVPLGEQYTVLDLITALQCRVLVVARNKLGVVNHTLLTLDVLRRHNVPGVKVVLIGTDKRGLAERTNAALITESTAGVPVLQIPFLGENPSAPQCLTASAKKLTKTLARILRTDTFSPAFEVLGRREKKTLAGKREQARL